MDLRLALNVNANMTTRTLWDGICSMFNLRDLALLPLKALCIPTRAFSISSDP